MDSFTDLDVWKKGCQLCEGIYAELGKCRDLGFRDQITRAALSIPSNIAEGYERGSRAEFIRFLRIAKGSSAEVRTQLFVGARVGLIEHARIDNLVEEAERISRMLQGLINSLQRRQIPPPKP